MPNVYDQFEPGVNPYDQFDETTKEGLPKDWLTYKPPAPALPQGPESAAPFGGTAPGQIPREEDISFTRALANRPTIPAEMLAGAVVQATEGAGKYLHKSIVDLSQMIERGTGLPVGLSGDESLYPTAYATEEGMKEKGLLPGAARFLYGLGKPENVALLPFAPTKPVQAYFTAGAVAGIPESMEAVMSAKTPEELREAYLNFGLNTTMAGLIGRHMMKGEGYAPEERVVQEGRVPEYPGTEAQRLPAKTSGGDLPKPAAPVEEKAPVSLTPIEASKEKLRILLKNGRAAEANAEIDWLLKHGVSGAEIHEAVTGKLAKEALTPEDAKYLETERLGIDADVAVGPEHLPKGQPFGPREVATINRETGKVVINPAEFSAALKDIPPEQRQSYVSSLIAEEQNHLATTPEDAKAYSEAMTGLEHAMERRAYTGRWTRAGAAEAAGRELSDTDIGFEAIRRRMQQLSRMSPTEIEMTVGKERWKLKTLNVMQRIVSRTMESLPTKGAEARRAVLQRVQNNLNVAIAAASGATPSSIRRPQDIADDIGARFDGEHLGRWMFTLYDKSGKESTTIVTKAGATPEEVRAKYDSKKAEYGDQANAPRSIRRQEERPGETTVEQMSRMSPKEAVEFFDRARAAGNAPQADSVLAGLTLGEEAIPEVTGLRDQSGKAMQEAFLKGDEERYKAEFGKNVWYSGVLEGIRREGPNYKEMEDAGRIPADVEGVKALEPESGRELTATESLIQRLGRNPSSLRRLPKEERQLVLGFIGKIEPSTKEPIDPRKFTEIGVENWSATDMLEPDVAPTVDALNKAGIYTFQSGRGQYAKPNTKLNISLEGSNLDQYREAIDALPPGWEIDKLPKESLSDAERNSVYDEYLSGRSTPPEGEYEDSAIVLDSTAGNISLTSDHVPDRYEIKQVVEAIKSIQSRLKLDRSPEFNDMLRRASAEHALRFSDKLPVRQAPSSIRRPKPPAEHPELFAEKPTYKTAARKRGLLSGTYEPVTSTAVDQLIQTHLSGEARPSFPDFLASLKERFGRVAPEQVRELWQQGVWDYLINAPGTELSNLVRSLGLRREIRVKGEKMQPGKTTGYGREIPDPPEGEERVKRFKQMELGTGAIVEGIEHEARTAEQQAREDAQRYRYKVISDIGSKLIRESETGRKSWKRTEVEPSEVAFWKESQEPAWNHITTDDLKDVDALGRVLTTDARQEATGTIRGVKRKTPPVSATKRLTAMLNKQTGKVELVSTFRDGRRGAVLLDPESPGKTHVPLKTILARYRPVYSVLIDEPVQNFRKSFKSLSEFEKEFGEEARGHRDEYVARVAELGEGAGVLSEEYGEGPSVLRPSEAITGPEAGSFYDSLKSAVGKLASPDDVRELILQLYGKMERNALLGKDWQTINTLEKAYYALRKKWPELTRSQVRDQTFDELFDIANRAGSREEFAAESIQRYSPEVRETSGRQPPPPPKAEPTSARELTARERIPPTVDPSVKVPKGEGPVPELPPTEPPEMLSDVEREFVEQMADAPKPEPKEPSPPAVGEHMPASLRRQKQTLEGEFARVSDALKAWNERRRTKSDITGWRDAADTVARNLARQAGDMVRVETMNPSIIYAFKKALLTPGGPDIKSLAFKHYREEQAKTAMVRAAAKTVLAAKGDRGLINNVFLPLVETGRVKAENMMAHLNPLDKYVGRRWLNAVDRLKAELEYARDHWDDSNLQATAAAVKREMEAEFEAERNHGIKIQHVEGYVPGRYEAEIFDDHVISFGDQRILGRNYRKPKQFENYYSAIARGPYIPKSYDAADLVEHRVRQGRMEIEKDGWIETLSNIYDPVSKQAIVKNPKDVDGTKVVPSDQYVLFSFGPNKKTVAIRKGYNDLIKMMVDAHGLDTSPVGKAALVGTGLLKHGIILILDTFHPGRLMQYMGALMGKEISTGRGGWSALDYRKEAIPKAIENGYVTPKAAAWAEAPVKLFMDGEWQTMTRRQVLEVMQRNGLNVGRLQDAIYKDLVRSWPVIGTLNRWTFDVMTRGLMAESAVRSFEKLNNKYPNEPAMRLMRDVIKDVNAYYGSLGRQGWIRHPMIRDLSQILFLAPQWVEGLVRKEAGLYGRLAMSPVRMAQGKPVLGTLGSGVARGLVAYFALTQILNLITRKHLTFQNKEEGHKLDAWIPTGGEGEGFWLSPMSVFAEITHDIIRLGESKKTNWEAIRQVGANKLGPLGRFAMILTTMENPQGQRLTSTGDVLGEAAKQLAPAPISLGTPIRALSHALFPKLVSPPRPGAMQQRLLGAVGIKVQPGDTAFQQAQRAATKFAESTGIKQETGFVLVPTDEPSYARLRNAIRNDDPKTAKSVMEHLRSTRTDADILKAMMLWSKRPLTGSSEGELQWLQEMDDDQFDTYSKALQERQDLWNKFVDFYMQN